jgi:hypothetical protein
LAAWWRRLWLDVADEELVELEPLLNVADEELVELEPAFAVELVPVLDLWLALVPVGELGDCVVVVPVGPLGEPAPAPHAHATPPPPENVRTVAITAKLVR